MGFRIVPRKVDGLLLSPSSKDSPFKIGIRGELQTEGLQTTRRATAKAPFASHAGLPQLGSRDFFARSKDGAQGGRYKVALCACGASEQAHRAKSHLQRGQSDRRLQAAVGLRESGLRSRDPGKLPQVDVSRAGRSCQNSASTSTSCEKSRRACRRRSSRRSARCETLRTPESQT